MIEFINVDSSAPYKKFISFYEKASLNGKFTDAICISSFNKILNQVDSRIVNIKYIIEDEWIFFTNYNSPKANDFESHDQISAVFFWPTIYSQIRMRAKIAKTSCDISDNHFKNRDASKNRIAIISEQSKEIESFKALVTKVENYDKNDNFSTRPDYWGGYSFKPYYFEFWQGNEQRLNKRCAYKKHENLWKKHILQP